MSDYISREAAINKIMENIVHQDSHDINLHNIGLRKAMSAIDSLSAADVVEVVRCRDCEWWGCAGCAIRIVDDTDKPRENDFCSFGERKDGGQHE